MKLTKSFIFAGLVTVLLFGQFALASAADIRYSTDRQNPNVIVGTDQTVRNLYAVGGQITVEANVAKDATVAAGNVNINGAVADNLLVAGGNVFVRGTIGGSARAVGGNISFENKVTEDVVAAGGTVTMLPSSTVAGDVVVAGGSLDLEGAVNGNVKFAGGALYINGPVGGNVNVRSTKNLKLGPKANIKGNLIYSSKTELVKDPSAKVGGQVTSLSFSAKGTKNAAGAIATGLLLVLLMQLAAAFVVFAIFKRSYTDLTVNSFRGFWMKVLWGLIFLILTPIVIVVLLFTVIGIYLAAVLAFLYILALLLSWLLAVGVVGSWVMAKINKRAYTLGFLELLVGVIVVDIIHLIPIVGFLFVLIMVLAGMGTILASFNSWRKA